MSCGTSGAVPVRVRADRRGVCGQGVWPDPPWGGSASRGLARRHQTGLQFADHRCSYCGRKYTLHTVTYHTSSQFMLCVCARACVRACVCVRFQRVTQSLPPLSGNLSKGSCGNAWLRERPSDHNNLGYRLSHTHTQWTHTLDTHTASMTVSKVFRS